MRHTWKETVGVIVAGFFIVALITLCGLAIRGAVLDDYEADSDSQLAQEIETHYFEACVEEYTEWKCYLLFDKSTRFWILEEGR